MGRDFKSGSVKSEIPSTAFHRGHQQERIQELYEVGFDTRMHLLPFRGELMIHIICNIIAHKANREL